jgi:site-specific recombinase XerD
MIKVEWAIDPDNSQRFHCVFDTATCLPVEPIQRFLNYCRQRRLAANTVSTYAYRLVDFWRWLETNALDWTEVDLEKLGDFVHWYLMGENVEVISEDVRETMSKRSARTVNQTVTAIQEFYTHHALLGRVDEKRFTKLVNGMGKRGGFLKGIVKSTPERRKRIKIKEPKLFPGCLKEEEVVALANACTTYRDRLIILLLRETGVRRGELLGLHLEDVKDLDVKGRIRIVRRDNNPNGAKAKGREREIPILHNRASVQETFNAYLLEEYPPEAERLEHGLLLVNLEGKHMGEAMSLGRLNKLFDQLYERTGIKAHPHLMRHTYATRMLQANYLDQYVQQLLGHQSIATTKDIYSHVLDEMTLEQYLKGGEEK